MSVESGSQGNFKRFLSSVRSAIDANEHKEERGWFINDSDFESYESDFRSVLRGTTIVNFVKIKPRPVVIDLMASSHTLASLFTKIGVNERVGISVSLSDRRTSEHTESDNHLGIMHIVGDIVRYKTWKEIQEKLNGRKADLIMERAEGGLEYLSRDMTVHFLLAKRAWSLLSEDRGMLLLQVPHVDEVASIERWVKHLNNTRITALHKSPGRNEEFGFLKLVKTPNSPKKLPFLPTS